MSSSPTETARCEVTMPQMGISVAEGTIVEWRKRARRLGRGRRDDLRRHHRQDRRRDPVAGQPAGSARILVEAGETVAVGDAARRDRRGRDGRARPIRRSPSDEAARPPGVEDDAPTAPAFHSPVCGGSPTSTASICRRSKGTGIGGRVRKKDVLALDRGRRSAAAAPSDVPPAAHRVAVPARRPTPNDERRTTNDAAATEVMPGASRADVPDAQAIAAAHGREPADGGPLHDRSSRSTCRRVAARAARAQAGDGAAWRRAHLPRLRRGARRSRRSSTTRS